MMVSALRTTLNLLNSREVLLLGMYFALTVVAAALETFGIGMIFLFFQAALDPTKLANIVGIQYVLPKDFDLSSRFLTYVSLSVFLTFVMRTGSQVLVIWFGQEVRRVIQLKLTKELFVGYLRQPYAWHLGKSPSSLYYNSTSNVAAVAQNCCIGSVDLFGSATLLLFFICALGWLKPAETVAAFSLIGLIAFVYTAFMHKRSIAWGESVMKSGEATVRAVSEPLRGIKTVKVLGLEKYFENILEHRVARYLRMNARQGLSQQAPRLMMELFLVAALLGAVTIGLMIGQAPADIIPTMALFGAAAYRIVPNAARITSSLQTLRFSIPSLSKVSEDLVAVRNQQRQPKFSVEQPFKELELKSLHFYYPGKRGAGITDISLKIRNGELIGLAGSSGAGKTTLVDILLGLLSPTTGEIKVNGAHLASTPQGLFGYVPQEPFLIEDTIRRNIALGVDDGDIDDAAMERALNAAAFDEVIARMPQGLATHVGEGGHGLSGGERQRLGIARAIYRDPAILIFDEPTSALDSVTESQVTNYLESLRGRKTVIVIAHRLSTVRNFDRIVFMCDGKIAAEDTFDGLYARRPDFREMVVRLSTQENTNTSGTSSENAEML
jgi:ATP-binding cassette, subfamily B, bacterial PglK